MEVDYSIYVATYIHEHFSVLWGHRVIVPTLGQKLVLEELYIGHPGVSRMKMLARSIVW